MTALDDIAAERRPWITINLNEGHRWGECPMCEVDQPLTRAVAWCEEARREDIGTILPCGSVVSGMCVCQPCHDRWYGLDRAERQGGGDA